jgi:holo-[acyl-carrier protein] synthase
MITGIGIDIIEISRFERKDTPAFLKRCYTENEILYMEGSGAQTAAGLFAAKEAVVKALGTGFRGFWPRDVEICHDEAGKPYVKLHGKAEQIALEFNAGHIMVSITHNKTTAAAVAAIM